MLEKYNAPNIRRSENFWKIENDDKCDVLKAEKLLTIAYSSNIVFLSFRTIKFLVENCV